MSDKQRKQFNPNVFSIMLNKLYRNRKGLIEFTDAVKNKNVYAKIFDFDTVKEVKFLTRESVDIVVTSPPYGDSRTTVAYGQYSRLSNQWLGISEANQVDKKLMGGTLPKEIEKFGLELLDEILIELSNLDPKRAREVFSFYRDYSKSIKNVASVVKEGGYVCYVVGNRKVKGLTLPTDEITKLFFELNNFSHITTIIRNIPNKRMPKRNSPSNQVGITDNTMSKEFVVVLRKN